MTITRRRIGVIGYGGIGRRLVDRIRADDRLDLALVFNRTSPDLPPALVLDDLAAREPDLVVEASHPIHTVEHGRSPDVTERAVLFDGPVRDIAPLFPRNVNSMVTLALATAGLDRCHARLVPDPDAVHGVLDVEARGSDSSILLIRREQPMDGVSGTEMFDSLWSSLVRAAGLTEPGIAFA